MVSIHMHVFKAWVKISIIKDVFFGQIKIYVDNFILWNSCLKDKKKKNWME